MNRKEFIQNSFKLGMVLAIPSSLYAATSQSLIAIKHVRHGLLDFDMDHPNVQIIDGVKTRLDQLFANGVSPNDKEDMFVLTKEVDGEIVQEMFVGRYP